MDSFLAQQVQGLRMESPQHSAPSSPRTVLGSRSSHVEHRQPQRVSPAHPVPASASSSSASSKRLRLNLRWNATTFNIWLDTNDSAEAFFLAFQQQASKRHEIFNRELTKISLKAGQQSSELSLALEDLEADWDSMVEWLRENKRDKPPHVYGEVEVEPG